MSWWRPGAGHGGWSTAQESPQNQTEGERQGADHRQEVGGAALVITERIEAHAPMLPGFQYFCHNPESPLLVIYL